MWRLLLNLILTGLLLALLAVGGVVYYTFRPMQLGAASQDFTIPPGMSMKRVAQEIAASGVPVQPDLLTLIARLTRLDNLVKAGSYEIANGTTVWELLEKLTRGDVTQAELFIQEGWNWRQVRAALDKHPELRHDSRGMSDDALSKALGIDAPHLEGQFFPDTYLFAKKSSDLDVLRRAHRTLKKELEKSWSDRNTGVPARNSYQLLILASLVEKETGKAEDRSKIASVFVNRLRQGMRLQTDPSVIYGLGERFDGNLRKVDLLTDTPYNTYTRAGLPPSPIAMPGRAALRAAAHPAATDYVYFVARGDGSSEFSRTLDEHNRAVARYQLRRGS